MQEALAKLRNKLFRKSFTRHIALAVGVIWALLINQLPSIPSFQWIRELLQNVQ